MTKSSNKSTDSVKGAWLSPKPYIIHRTERRDKKQTSINSTIQRYPCSSVQLIGHWQITINLNLKSVRTHHKNLYPTFG